MIHLEFFGPYDAGTPFRDEGDDDFSCFNELSGRAGVYVFQCKASGKTLYVGKSESGRLNERISQHYGETNTGGNFRINWCKAHCRSICGDGREYNNKKQCNGDDLSSYHEFKRLVQGSKLIVFSLGRKDGQGRVCADTKGKISEFEEFLIRMLESRWNIVS